MANLKSLQEGGPEVIDETKQIAQALTKMVNEQDVTLQQALMQMFKSGLQEQQAIQALMSMGYTEQDIKSMFDSMQAQPQQEQSELIEDEEPETIQQEMQEEQQQQPQAKKGKEKYNTGGGFKSWMNRNLGFISDNDRYDVPIQYSNLPTAKRDAGLDFVTNMFRLGKRAANVVKDAKARKNDSSYNKYSIKFGKDANPDDFYITDESLYEASKTGNLITKDEAKQMMKDKSRIMYDPSSKAYSFALVTNPFESESNIQKQINQEMGKGYRNRYKEASLPQYEALSNFFKSYLPKQLGGGTHNTYYGQVGMEYPGTIDQSQFPGFTFGNIGDNTLTFRQWFAQNYGGNLDMTAQSQPELLKQYQNYLDNENAFKGDIFEEPDEAPLQTIQQPDIFEPIKNIEPDYTDQEVDAYMNFSKDLSESNLVNKGSMGKQPSVEAKKQLQDAMPKDTSAKVKIKSKGAFSKAFDTATDVAGLAVDAGRSINKLLQDAENLKKYNEIVYGTADEQFGTDIGSKGYWTALDGILSPNKQTTFIGKKGKEMKNFMDYFKMQYGGVNLPQMQQDNTRVNQMSVADIQALVNATNQAYDEETFFKYFPHLKNMNNKAYRDPALQESDTNVVIKDGKAYYPKYASDYAEGEEGSGDNRGLVKEFLDPKQKSIRSMIPYFEVGSDPNSVSLMRKFKNSNLPFDFGNAFPRGYVDVEEYLQNISPVGRKMQIGGMNAMSDFFMDNDLPMYQGDMGSNEIPRFQPTQFTPTQTLSPDQLDRYRSTIDINDPGHLKRLFNKDKTVNVNSPEFKLLDRDIQRQLAAASQEMKFLGKGMSSQDSMFMQEAMGDPAKKRIEYIYNDHMLDNRYKNYKTEPLTPEEQRAREEYIIKLKEQQERVKRKRQEGPAYEQRYGGDPFMPKRKLRKKKGGQIGNIATQTLKNLMKKYPNFKYSNYED